MSYRGAGLLLDLSKQSIDAEISAALTELAAERELARRIEDLFTGVAVNSTEQRPALHTALRAPAKERPSAAAGVAGMRQRPEP